MPPARINAAIVCLNLTSVRSQNIVKLITLKREVPLSTSPDYYLSYIHQQFLCQSV